MGFSMKDKIEEAEDMLLRARQLEYNANSILDNVCKGYKALNRHDMWDLIQNLPDGLHKSTIYTHYSGLYGRDKGGSGEQMPD